MIMLAPTTDTTIVGDADALASSVSMMIADARIQYSDCPFGTLSHHTSGGVSHYIRSSQDALVWGHRPVALEMIAKDWECITSRLVETHMFIVSTSHGQPTTSQIKSAYRPAWRPQIKSASTYEEIVAVLRLFGLDTLADRLGYLCSLADDDPDEPRIEVGSLREMALFLMGERQLLDPRIGVTLDGLIQIEWRVPDSGILAMVFLPSGLIRFAAISAPARSGVDRWSVNGMLPKDDALAAVRPFTEHIRLI